jgi:hypothetical protein
VKRVLCVKASEIEAGDMLLDVHGEYRRVVRHYPNGQSGKASFCEVSFGSVCTSIYPDTIVVVQRDDVSIEFDEADEYYAQQVELMKERAPA